MDECPYQLLDELNTTDYDALKADISERGIMVPVELDEHGNILDGHHRVRIARELGIKDYPTIIRTGLSEQDKRNHVRALNILRRHLSGEQRKKLFAEMRSEGMTLQAIADATGVSHETVRQATNDNPVFKLLKTDKVTGKDGKSYPAKKPRLPKPTPSIFAGSAKDTQRAVAVAQTVENLPAKVVSLKRAEEIARKEPTVKSPVSIEQFDTPDCRIVQADVTDFLDSLPESSVDLIVTDPPYSTDSLPLYFALAKGASRVLKPGGSCLVMTGQLLMHKIMEFFPHVLNYQWTLAYLTPGGQSPQIWTAKVNTFWKPVLWFTKGDYSGEWNSDVIKSDGNDKQHHKWGQSESGIAELVERYSKPGDMVIDPFLGGGTTAVVCVRTGRRFAGCDNDSSAVAATQSRIKEVINEC